MNREVGRGYIRNGMGITGGGVGDACSRAKNCFGICIGRRARGKSRRSGKSRSNVELGSNARRWPTDRATEREAYRGSGNCFVSY